ncbi:MAG: hypothetical protein RL609_1494 [Bacteroidota bacterium]
MRSNFFMGFWLVIFFWSCKGNQQEVQPVKNDITETVFASGQLVANDRYNLTAQSEGYLSEVPVKEGDVLEQGTMVARIDNSTVDAQAQAAERQLNIAKQNITEASPALQEAKAASEIAEQKMNQEKKQADRYQALYQSQSVSKLELENAQLAYESAKTNWIAAKKRMAQIQQQADWTQAGQEAVAAQQRNASGYNLVQSLAKSRVMKLMKKAGDYVRKGDVIAVMAGTQQIVAQLNVDENSIKKIKVGQRAHIQLNVDKGQVLEGIVTTLYPLYDETSQSFLCDVVFEKPLSFDVIGTRLEANIDVASRKQVLLIPRAYLSYSNTVQVKGEEAPRSVEVGIRSTEWVEITSGLTEQDVLIPLKK